jgi:hypothetical protein
MWGSSSPDYTLEQGENVGPRQNRSFRESPRPSPAKSGTTTVSTCTPLSPELVGEKASLRADAPAFEFSPPHYNIKRPSLGQGGAFDSPQEFAM